MANEAMQEHGVLEWDKIDGDVAGNAFSDISRVLGFSRALLYLKRPSGCSEPFST
jgi:hypothetical protein